MASFDYTSINQVSSDSEIESQYNDNIIEIDDLPDTLIDNNIDNFSLLSFFNLSSSFKKNRQFDFNDSNFKLKPNSETKAYIFQNNLFI